MIFLTGGASREICYNQWELALVACNQIFYFLRIPSGGGVKNQLFSQTNRLCLLEFSNHNNNYNNNNNNNNKDFIKEGLHLVARG